MSWSKGFVLDIKAATVTMLDNCSGISLEMKMLTELGVIKLNLILLLAGAVISSNIDDDRQNINLSADGGYIDILVSIDKRVPENMQIIYKLQEYLSEASRVLLTATNDRLYFRNFTILVPDSWAHNDTWSEPAEDETTDRARIVVAEANLAYGDEPYTLQPGGCEQEGDYIHFTPAYLTEMSANDTTYRPAKRTVKEFAKLKWGLFNENIPVSDTETSRFYFKDGKLQAQGCVGDIFFDYKNPTQCNPGSGPPPVACDLLVSDVEGSASLLSYEYLDSVTGFCTEDENNATHNVLSQNLQNVNCQSRSAWKVMLELEDFVIDYKLTRVSDIPEDPYFKIVQRVVSGNSASNSTITSELSNTTSTNNRTEEEAVCSQDVVCLCLDVSGSMQTSDRITTMSEAVQLYILSYLRNGTAVGIVSFSTFAYVEAYMTEITSDAVRENLRAAVPTEVKSSTNIERGLDECQQILRDYTGGDISHTRMLLHSDGLGTVGESIQRLANAGVTLDTVLFDQGGFLAEQAKETGGKEFLASDGRGDAGLLAFYEETSSRACEPETADVLLVNEVINISSGDSTYRGQVYFDITIGLNTKMVFQYEVAVDISILTNLEVTLTKDVNLMTTIVTIHGELENSVDYIISRNLTTSEASITVTVTSSPIPGAQPITTKSRINSKNIQFSPNTELIVYMGIFQGYSPILQLTIIATLEDPAGGLASILYTDDGTGKDSVPNDGIYTGFLPPHLIGGSLGGSFYGLANLLMFSALGSGTEPTRAQTPKRPHSTSHFLPGKLDGQRFQFLLEAVCTANLLTGSTVGTYTGIENYKVDDEPSSSGSGATLLTADMPKIRVPAHLTDLFLLAQCNCTKPRQADHLTRLLTHYRSIFSTKCENMCRISTVEHSVLLKENTGPIRQPLH
ncbi:calcium-activated chloride channel regulator 1-like [Watersipora subatra]|uniref:calcium-activated chloride channel regulator 1-like n=1 Tax=Watersipora subatra TaxID=2589382 RepID=UPI00355B0D2A